MNDLSFYSFLNDPLWWGVIIPNGKFNDNTSNFKAQGMVLETKFLKNCDSTFSILTSEYFQLMTSFDVYVCFAVCFCFHNCKFECNVCPVAILDNNLEMFEIKEARCRNTVEQSIFPYFQNLCYWTSFLYCSTAAK